MNLPDPKDTGEPLEPVLDAQVPAKINNGPIKRKYMNQLKHGSTACLHAKDLRPWMKAYAEWLSLQVQRPGIKERRAVVNKLAHDKVSWRAIRFLEQRTDFLAYYDRFAQGGVSAARAMLEAQSPWYVEQHRLGLEAAMKKGDYKAVPNFTTPILERAWPRRDGAVESVTQVNITISPRQQVELTQDAPQLLPAEIVEDAPPA